MNEYRRFISYIYAYPGNVKEKNVGFAKVEVRNGQCRLDMTLNGVYMDSSKLYGVSLMVKEQENYILVPIGNILVSGGQGKYRDLLNPDNLNGSSYSLSDGVGIAVADKEDSYYRMFSLWNDDIFKPENVRYHEELKVEHENEQSEESEKSEQEKTIGVTKTQDFDAAQNADEVVTDGSGVTQNAYEAPYIMQEMEEAVHEEEFVAEAEEEFMPEEEEYDKDTDEPEISKPVFTEVETKYNDIKSEIHAASAPAVDVERGENALQWLINHGDLIDTFEDDNLYDCVEVMPEQLRKALGNSRAFDDNSFMMHGFYRFHHLLLGRVQENGNNTRYFIGIPGMYCNRERYMASVFGFGNFKKSHRGDYNNPYFGYWYQEI